MEAARKPIRAALSRSPPTQTMSLQCSLGGCDLVPEVHRMHAVEGLTGAVEVDIPGVVGELAPRSPPRSVRVRGDGQDIGEEVHVGRMVQRRELARQAGGT